jgi:hypothetical protein
MDTRTRRVSGSALRAADRSPRARSVIYSQDSLEANLNGARFVARMSKPRRNPAILSLDDPLFPVKQRKPVPHEFVLDALAPLSPVTRPMFGCLAIYVGDKVHDKVQDKIVLILRDKRDQTSDNGVWLATTAEHHQSLRRDFPNMRSIQVLGKKVTGWQVLPADAEDFEQAALHACELVLAGDPRIGKVPGARVTHPFRKGREKDGAPASASAARKAAKSSKKAKAPSRTAKTRARP